MTHDHNYIASVERGAQYLREASYEVYSMGLGVCWAPDPRLYEELDEIDERLFTDYESLRDYASVLDAALWAIIFDTKAETK